MPDRQVQAPKLVAASMTQTRKRKKGKGWYKVHSNALAVATHLPHVQNPAVRCREWLGLAGGRAPIRVPRSLPPASAGPLFAPKRFASLGTRNRTGGRRESASLRCPLPFITLSLYRKHHSSAFKMRSKLSQCVHCFRECAMKASNLAQPHSRAYNTPKPISPLNPSMLLTPLSHKPRYNNNPIKMLHKRPQGIFLSRPKGSLRLGGTVCQPHWPSNRAYALPPPFVDHIGRLKANGPLSRKSFH